MLTKDGYYLQRIKEDFARRQRTNSAYSLRAYARDLGIPASTLSQVLLSKRPLPLKNASHVISKLKLTPRERTYFMDSLGKRHVALDSIKIEENDERFILDDTYHQIIAEWEHYAALILMDCEDFTLNPESLTVRLGITKIRAEVVIANLLRYGMISEGEKSGSFLRTHSSFRTTEDVVSEALRASHHENLDLAKIRLDETPIQLRDFSSLMVAVDLEKMNEAKAIIREFRQKMSKLLRSGNRRHVYQLSIQFYPITKSPPTSNQHPNKKQESNHVTT